MRLNEAPEEPQMPENVEFTADHSAQYKVLSDDMRFLSDQRFKILTAYLLTAGLIANVVKDRPNVALCLFGAILAFLCFSWEQATSRWWGTLITQCQAIEDIAIAQGKMVACYKRYEDQNPKKSIQRIPHPRPSLAVAWIYALSFLGWLVASTWVSWSWLANHYLGRCL
jgi:hypothetical protein